jgi:fructokinase
VSADSTTGKHVLCLGEALIDMICERQVDELAEADMFVRHFGGAVANVAVIAARAGARVSLAGGAGDDPWGAWLRDQLEDNGVELSWFELLDGLTTPLSLVTVDRDGIPSYTIYGEAIDTIVHALRSRVEEALSAASALFISSNTLVAAGERDLTMRARSLALERGLPVIFDPNLRLRRWRTHADAAATVNACVPGALLVRATAAEATLMTGEEDVERAAMSLLKAGSEMVVLTLGSEGAILRGRLRADVEGVPARVISTIGAGDVLTGTLLARLAVTGFYPPAVAASLREAVAAAARACERWGAID